MACPRTVRGESGSAGTQTHYSRSDHQHGEDALPADQDTIAFDNAVFSGYTIVSWSVSVSNLQKGQIQPVQTNSERFWRVNPKDADADRMGHHAAGTRFGIRKGASDYLIGDIVSIQSVHTTMYEIDLAAELTTEGTVSGGVSLYYLHQPDADETDPFASDYIRNLTDADSGDTITEGNGIDVSTPDSEKPREKTVALDRTVFKGDGDVTVTTPSTGADAGKVVISATDTDNDSGDTITQADGVEVLTPDSSAPRAKTVGAKLDGDTLAKSSDGLKLADALKNKLDGVEEGAQVNPKRVYGPQKFLDDNGGAAAGEIGFIAADNSTIQGGDYSTAAAFVISKTANTLDSNPAAIPTETPTDSSLMHNIATRGGYMFFQFKELDVSNGNVLSNGKNFYMLAAMVVENDDSFAITPSLWAGDYTGITYARGWQVEGWETDSVFAQGLIGLLTLQQINLDNSSQTAKDALSAIALDYIKARAASLKTGTATDPIAETAELAMFVGSVIDGIPLSHLRKHIVPGVNEWTGYVLGNADATGEIALTGTGNQLTAGTKSVDTDDVQLDIKHNVLIALVKADDPTKYHLGLVNTNTKSNIAGVDYATIVFVGGEFRTVGDFDFAASGNYGTGVKVVSYGDKIRWADLTQAIDAAAPSHIKVASEKAIVDYVSEEVEGAHEDIGLVAQLLDTFYEGWTSVDGAHYGSASDIVANLPVDRESDSATVLPQNVDRGNPQRVILRTSAFVDKPTGMDWWLDFKPFEASSDRYAVGITANGADQIVWKRNSANDGWDKLWEDGTYTNDAAKADPVFMNHWFDVMDGDILLADALETRRHQWSIPGISADSMMLYRRDGRDVAAMLTNYGGGNIINYSWNRFRIDAAHVYVTAGGFDGNLATTDDDVQAVAQKVDDLVIPSDKTLYQRQGARAELRGDYSATGDYVRFPLTYTPSSASAKLKVSLVLHGTVHGNSNNLQRHAVAIARWKVSSGSDWKAFISQDDDYSVVGYRSVQALGYGDWQIHNFFTEFEFEPSSASEITIELGFRTYNQPSGAYVSDAKYFNRALSGGVLNLPGDDSLGALWSHIEVSELKEVDDMVATPIAVTHITSLTNT